MNKLKKSTEVAPQRNIAGPVIWTIVHALLWLALLLVLIAVVPRFERTFDDFDTKLPYLTQVVIAAGSFARRYWYLLVVMWTSAAAADLLLLLMLKSMGATLARGIWAAMVAVVAVVLVGAALLALWLPLVSLMQNLA